MELNEMKAKITILINEEDEEKLQRFLNIKKFDVKIYYEDKPLLTNNNKSIKE